MTDHAANLQQLRRLASGPSERRAARISVGHLFSRPCSSLVFLLAAAVLMLGPAVWGGQEDSVAEYELKAAILYNLPKFVEWPSDAYPDSQAPTVLCILGRDPFGSALASLVDRKVSTNRPILVRHLRETDPIDGCHVLFVSSSERRMVTQVFASVKGASVLTVGEMDQFAARGGIIQFALQEKEVHFEINRDAASREGLKISSRLLALGKVVSSH